jgi:hypothetical protein
MKTLFWKIRCAYWMRKLLFVPWSLAWEMAGAHLEQLDAEDIQIWSPKSVAEEEREEWRNCS